MGSTGIRAAEKRNDSRGVPHVGSRVRQVGSENVYVVLRVDTERRLADLLLLSGVPRVEENMPFECLRELGQHGSIAYSDLVRFDCVGPDSVHRNES